MHRPTRGSPVADVSSVYRDTTTSHSDAATSDGVTGTHQHPDGRNAHLHVNGRASAADRNPIPRADAS
jgi:hypothetical protein